MNITKNILDSIKLNDVKTYDTINALIADVGTQFAKSNVTNALSFITPYNIPGGQVALSNTTAKSDTSYTATSIGTACKLTTDEITLLAIALAGYYLDNEFLDQNISDVNPAFWNTVYNAAKNYDSYGFYRDGHIYIRDSVIDSLIKIINEYMDNTTGFKDGVFNPGQYNYVSISHLFVKPSEVFDYYLNNIPSEYSKFTPYIRHIATNGNLDTHYDEITRQYGNCIMMMEWDSYNGYICEVFLLPYRNDMILNIYNEQLKYPLVNNTDYDFNNYVITYNDDMLDSNVYHYTMRQWGDGSSNIEDFYETITFRDYLNKTSGYMDFYITPAYLSQYPFLINMIGVSAGQNDPTGIIKQIDAIQPKNIDDLYNKYTQLNKERINNVKTDTERTYMPLNPFNIKNPLLKPVTQTHLVTTTPVLTDDDINALLISVENGTADATQYGGDIKPNPDSTDVGVTPDLFDIANLDGNLNLFTVYNLSMSDVQTFASSLYSETALDKISKLFADPIQSVMGLYRMPLNAEVVTDAKLKITGNIFNEIDVKKVIQTIQEIDCGTINIDEYFGNVMDYEPYTKISLFIPYVGFVTLNTNDIMNSSINLKIRVNITTGSFVAYVRVIRGALDGILYSFNGICSTQYPITQRDLNNMFRYGYGMIQNMSGLAVTAATGGFTDSTGSLQTGQIINSGINSSNPINMAQSFIPTIKRSGGFDGQTGHMLFYKPFVIINRPISYESSNYNYYYGFPINKTVTLKNESGFVRVRDIHLNNINCTDDEKSMIEQLLKTGVLI